MGKTSPQPAHSRASALSPLSLCTPPERPQQHRYRCAARGWPPGSSTGDELPVLRISHLLIDGLGPVQGDGSGWPWTRIVPAPAAFSSKSAGARTPSSAGDVRRAKGAARSLRHTPSTSPTTRSKPCASRYHRAHERGVNEQLGRAGDLRSPDSLSPGSWARADERSPFGPGQPGDPPSISRAIDRSAPGARRQDGDRLVLGARPDTCGVRQRRPARQVLEGVPGTNQVAPSPQRRGLIKARSPPNAVRPGDVTGLALRPEKLSLFDKASGRVLRSALHRQAGVAHG